MSYRVAIATPGDCGQHTAELAADALVPALPGGYRSSRRIGGPEALEGPDRSQMRLCRRYGPARCCGLPDASPATIIAASMGTPHATRAATLR